jgi:uncharacterized protein
MAETKSRKEYEKRLEDKPVDCPKAVEAVVISSPCNQICAINLPTGYCSGCGRTLNEIAEWSTASATRQRAILAELPYRLILIAAQPH